MSLIDPRETRVTISPEWNPTIAEIVKFFEEKGWSKIIDELLCFKSVKKYFKDHLVDDFESYTKPKVKLNEQTKEDIAWLLNKNALWRDLKVNVEIQVLKKSANIDEAWKDLTLDKIMDVIYDLEENVDKIFGEIISNPLLILWHRTEEKRENNVFRRTIVLIEE